MKRHISITVLAALILLISAPPVSAQNRVIVRDTGGLLGIQQSCQSVGCTVNQGLDGTQGQLFLVTPNSGGGGGLIGGLLNVAFNLLDFLTKLLLQPGVSSAEVDHLVNLSQASSSTYMAPSALYDTTPVTYYGTTVRDGYVHQPAVQIISLTDAQTAYNVSGTGIVAVIDTGVDVTHPVLKNVLVSGYDFTRNTPGGSELTDVNQSTAAVVDGYGSGQVNQSTAAVVDGNGSGQVNQSTAAVVDGNGSQPAMVNQSTAAVVDGNGSTSSYNQQPQYRDFGHGTMVSGVVHLVAPTAKIMPLKAFKADGTGYTSDIIRAIYYAAQHHATVLNMSFSFPAYSPEVARAVGYATASGDVCVAAAGNDGKDELVYPAALKNVMGVASTSDTDTLSSFSNYGQNLVWMAAPGEGVVTLYPFGHYAAAWGTSFSTPFVSGTAALFDTTAWRAAVPPQTESAAARALAHALYISPDLGNGRLDIYQAVGAWEQMSWNVPQPAQTGATQLLGLN